MHKHDREIDRSLGINKDGLHWQGQLEEQMRELGHHLDCQHQQLADSVDSQQQIQVLSVQNEEYQSQLVRC